LDWLKADGGWLLADGKAQTTAGVFSMALRTADPSERPLADVGQKAVLQSCKVERVAIGQIAATCAVPC
jgi:hypothetical protein